MDLHSISPKSTASIIRMLLCPLVLCSTLLHPAATAEAAQRCPPTLAFLTNQQSGDVSVLDTRRGVITDTLKVGKEPAGISVSSVSPRAYVSNPGDKTISVIDTRTIETLRSIPVGEGPLALLVDDRRAQLYVADWHLDIISVVSVDSLAIVAEIPVGRSPSGLALSADSRYLYVSNRDDHSISRVNLDTLEVDANMATGERPFGITLSADGKRLYTANVQSNSVTVIDLPSRTVLSEISVGDRPYDVALAKNDSLAFVTDQYDNTVSVINTENLQVIKTIEVGEYPEGIDTHPDDRHVYVANWFDNTVGIIDSHTLEMIDTIDTGDGTRAYGNFFATHQPFQSPEANEKKSILVLDFELNDLTLHPAVELEEKRVKTLKPLLIEDLQQLEYPLAPLSVERQQAESHGKGYIFDRPAVAARLGKLAGSDWVLTGRLHKASFLFVYLKAQLIDTSTAELVADFVIEIKGWEPRLTAKGVEALAVKLDKTLSVLREQKQDMLCKG